MSGAPASQPVDPLLLVEHTRQTKAGPAHHLADHHDQTMAIVHRHHRHVEAPLHLPGGGAGNLPRGHRRGAIEELQGEMPHQPDKLQAHPLDLGTHRLPHRGRGHLRHLPGPGTRRLPPVGAPPPSDRERTACPIQVGGATPTVQIEECTACPIPVGSAPAPSRSRNAPPARPDRGMHHLPHPGRERLRAVQIWNAPAPSRSGAPPPPSRSRNAPSGRGRHPHPRAEPSYSRSRCAQDREQVAAER